MTIVGYGDKTPKTPIGRFIAVLWMLGSLALISLLSTSLVARMTADRVEAGQIPRNGDLEGKRLAAVANSSGAEYLDEEHFQYTKYTNLQEALASMASGRSDAVVNSVGAIFDLDTIFRRNSDAARSSRAGIYGIRTAAAFATQEVPRQRTDRDHGKRRVAIIGGQLLREVEH
jgi:ABC-type amino acid transport substrate-binding protein